MRVRQESSAASSETIAAITLGGSKKVHKKLNMMMIDDMEGMIEDTIAATTKTKSTDDSFQLYLAQDRYVFQ